MLYCAVYFTSPPWYSITCLSVKCVKNKQGTLEASAGKKRDVVLVTTYQRIHIVYGGSFWNRSIVICCWINKQQEWTWAVCKFEKAKKVIHRCAPLPIKLRHINKLSSPTAFGNDVILFIQKTVVRISQIQVYMQRKIIMCIHQETNRRRNLNKRLCLEVFNESWIL